MPSFLDPQLKEYLQKRQQDMEGARFEDDIREASQLMGSVGGNVKPTPGKSAAFVKEGYGLSDPLVIDYIKNKNKPPQKPFEERLAEAIALTRAKEDVKQEYKPEEPSEQENLDRLKKEAEIREGAKPPKENQFKAANFGRRMEQAMSIMDNLSQRGFDRTAYNAAAKNYLLGKVGLDSIQDADYRQQAQAERNFINATLRRESGAAIAPHEYANAELQYFPRPGDDEQTLANKKANRQQVIASMKAEADRAWDMVPYIDPFGAQGRDANSGVEYKEIRGRKYRKVKGGWEAVDAK